MTWLTFTGWLHDADTLLHWERSGEPPAEEETSETGGIDPLGNGSPPPHRKRPHSTPKTF